MVTATGASTSIRNCAPPAGGPQSSLPGNGGGPPVVDAQSVLRVFSFQPRGNGSAVDETFRATIVPDILQRAGLLDAFVGRRSVDLGERVFVSVWASTEAMKLSHDEVDVVGRLHAEERPALQAARLELGNLAFGVRAPRHLAPHILRVVRGTVRSGELEAYVDEAHAGTIADERLNEGLIALYLATTGETTFTTVSAWTGWDAIEGATGGDVRRPLATKHSERLMTFEGAHYEVLPNVARPDAGGRAVA
jgi:hypothetical protein